MSKLFDIIGENLLIEKIAKGDIVDPKVKYSQLDVINKNILSFCNTPRTDSHIKQFFTARDEEGNTIDFDNRVQFLKKECFLDHAYTKYVVNPKYRQFITVIPMTASKISINIDDIISDIEKFEKAKLSESQIILKIMDKYGVSEKYAYDILKSSKHFEKHITEKEADESPTYGTGGDLGVGVTDRTEREEMRESIIGPKVSFNLKKKSKNLTELHKIFESEFNTSIDDFLTGESFIKFIDYVKDKGFSEKDVIEYVKDTYKEDVANKFLDLLKSKVAISKESSIKQAEYYIKQQVNKTSINKNNIHYEATNFVRRFLSNYRFPLPPTIKFNAIKSASLDENNNLNGEVTLSIEFKTLSNLKKRADITVPIINGQMIEPSVILADGQSHVISQSAIDNISKGATFYSNVSPRKNHLSNPVPRVLEDMYKDKKIPNIKKDMFSV